MYIIIIGCGRMGSELALMLTDEGHDIVIIDKDPRAFKRLGNSFNGMTITGNGYNCELLEQAGIKETQALASVTNEDNTNIIAIQIAKQIYNVPIAVARVYDPHKAATYNQLGLEIINTTTVISRMFRDRFLEGMLEANLRPYKEKVEIYKIEAKDALIGRAIRDLFIPGVFSIFMVSTKGRVILPEQDYRLMQGDTLIGVGDVNEKQKISNVLRGDAVV